jgi:hypothetical protein
LFLGRFLRGLVEHVHCVISKTSGPTFPITTCRLFATTNNAATLQSNYNMNDGQMSQGKGKTFQRRNKMDNLIFPMTGRSEFISSFIIIFDVLLYGLFASLFFLANSFSENFCNLKNRMHTTRENKKLFAPFCCCRLGLVMHS